ncbi:DUF3048 domain-containing protein [Brevibacillus daliensis]|uniref:DUF3048 domain-containing protein n=1 Tax=Brevibacillus daliensis TaxID=2892995 RepID=UPI001E5F16A4|nr:DUF3048 domain-containing protein [Brevibacillus daliensis]
MKKMWTTVLTILATASILTACNSNSEPQQPSNPNPPITEPAQEKPAAFKAPLTGLPMSEQLTNRPVMAMINNHPKARPQSGLQDADMVIEVLSEGEITRFLAVFQSNQPNKIGPVRSIRPYFIKLGRGFDAVLSHVGGSPDALQILAGADDDINEISNSSYFWRDKSRKAPHNVYTSMENMNTAMQDKQMRMKSELPYFPFLAEDTVITEGQPADLVNIELHKLYSLHYEYDPDKKKYLRFTEGKPHNDLETDKQLEVTNLMVIATKHQVLDAEGRRDVDVTGPGDGYLFQQGKAKPIKWARINGIIRAYEDIALTQEIPLLPGNTWINIVPNSPSFDAHLKFQ